MMMMMIHHAEVGQYAPGLGLSRCLGPGLYAFYYSPRIFLQANKIVNRKYQNILVYKYQNMLVYKYQKYFSV